MNEEALSRMYLKETSFQALMQHRVFNVLLIASPYDAFMMEEDGRVEEQLYNEYVALNLSSPPRVNRASTMTEALEMMRQKPFDLVVAMPGGDISETFDGAALIKDEFPAIPLVVLTPFSKGGVAQAGHARPLDGGLCVQLAGQHGPSFGYYQAS